MSIKGFAKVITRLPQIIWNHGFKRGFCDYGIKQSIKQVGVVPAVAGIIAYPIGAAAGMCIPGTGLAASLATTIITRGAIQTPGVIKNLALKSKSIFTK